jgi:hypothetical protein
MMHFIRKNLSDILMVIGIVGVLLVLGSWLYGYWSNGLYGTHFQVESCWTGVGAMGMGFVGLCRYLIDSGLNSNRNEPPK